MKVLYLAAMTVALSVSATSFAADKPETLFVAGNCNNCHAADHKTVGPSLIDIAAKYKDDKEARAKLEQKVRLGGSGSWGVLPMPGTRASISDESIKILVAWILEQKAKPADEPKADKKADPKAK
jgi:cytochrome c